MKKSLRDSAKQSPERINNDISESSDINEVVNKYRGKSEDELMRELLSITEKQKVEGSFDPSALQAGIEAITPLLNQEQRRRLFEITSRL